MRAEEREASRGTEGSRPRGRGPTFPSMLSSERLKSPRRSLVLAMGCVWVGTSLPGHHALTILCRGREAVGTPSPTVGPVALLHYIVNALWCFTLL